MATEYRVVFSGEVLEGFDPAAVKQAASERLKASPEQIERLFTGRPAVLKKGLGQETAKHYLAKLRSVGMLAKLEPMPSANSESAVAAKPLPPQPAPATRAIVSDLEKTQLASADSLARYLSDQVNLASAPTLVVPRAHVAEHTRPEHVPTDPGSTPTFIVPREQVSEVRRQIEQSMAATLDPANAPTLIVPRTTQSNSTGTATVMIEAGVDALRSTPPTTKRHDPERTLIATEDALEAYLAANSSASPMGNMTTTDLGLPTSAQVNEAPAHNKTPEAERTLIANEGALESYLAANSGASPMGNMLSTDIRQSSTLQGRDLPLPLGPSNPVPAPMRRRIHPLAALANTEAPAQAAASLAATPVRPFQSHSSMAEDYAAQSAPDAYANKRRFGLLPKGVWLVIAIMVALLGYWVLN